MDTWDIFANFIADVWKDVMELGRTIVKAITDFQLKFYERAEQMMIDVHNRRGQRMGTVHVDQHNIDAAVNEFRRVLEQQLN